MHDSSVSVKLRRAQRVTKYGKLDGSQPLRHPPRLRLCHSGKARPSPRPQSYYLTSRLLPAASLIACSASSLRLLYAKL